VYNPVVHSKTNCPRLERLDYEGKTNILRGCKPPGAQFRMTRPLKTSPVLMLAGKRKRGKLGGKGVLFPE